MTAQPRSRATEPNGRDRRIEEARAVHVEDELARRGITLRGRGSECCGPCPRCGGTDRFSVNVKKQVWICRKCPAGGDVIELVRHLDGLSFGDAVRLLMGAAMPQKPGAGALHAASWRVDSAPRAETGNNGPLAAWLWGNRELASESCPAWLYLRRTRCYGGPIPSTLGYLPANGKHPPAMIAAFGFCEEPEPGVIDPPAEVRGVHLTRLTMEGGKAPIDPAKIMLGPSAGLPIVLAPANDLLAIDIVEGIETGLSVLALRGAGVWVAGAAGRMPKLVESLPPYTECLHIFAERDEAGLRFAREAARLAVARGVETHVKAFGEAVP